MASKKKLLALGIVSWDGVERRTNRYGAILLGPTTYDDKSVGIDHTFDKEVAVELDGKRVHMTATVLEDRISGHMGDLALGIVPIKPERGDVIDLGVGILQFGKLAWATEPSIVLKPGDDRQVFWFNPHDLYRLHDQSVALYVEETEADFTPAPEIDDDDSVEAISTGDGFQAKTKKDSIRIEPRVESLGGGLFSMTPPSSEPFGKRLKVGR